MAEEHEHVSRDGMERFLRAETSPGETKGIVRHLLAQCQECLEAARAVAEEEGLFSRAGAVETEWSEVGRERYTEVFLRVLGRGSEEEVRLAREKVRALGLWSELKELRPRARLARVRREARFQTWGLAERLLEVGREAAFREPAAAVELALLALAVGERLDPARYGRERIDRLRVAAWGDLANARRLGADFAGAESTLREARAALEAGPGDPMAEARLLSLEASLRKDLGDFEGAVERLDRAIEIHGRGGDLHLQGRCLLQQAGAIGYVDPERGVTLAQEGLARIDPAREPRLELCARHTAAWFLVDSGRPREALAMLELSRLLYAQFRDAWVRLRLHWLEGRIARSLGDLAEAEATFARLWGEARERELHFEAALLALDLAEVYVARGKAREARRLVEEVHPLLSRWGLHAEGLAVWLLLRQALAWETAQAEAFKKTAEYLRRAWHRPLE